MIKCPKCGSTRVNMQAVGITKTKGKGGLYWLLIGWWLEPLLWLCFTLPMVIVKIFGRKKVTTKTKSVAICQDCGHHWYV